MNQNVRRKFGAEGGQLNGNRHEIFEFLHTKGSSLLFTANVNKHLTNGTSLVSTARPQFFSELDVSEIKRMNSFEKKTLREEKTFSKNWDKEEFVNLRLEETFKYIGKVNKEESIYLDNDTYQKAYAYRDFQTFLLRELQLRERTKNQQGFLNVMKTENPSIDSKLEKMKKEVVERTSNLLPHEGFYHCSNCHQVLIEREQMIRVYTQFDNYLDLPLDTVIPFEVTKTQISTKPSKKYKFGEKIYELDQTDEIRCLSCKEVLGTMLVIKSEETVLTCPMLGNLKYIYFNGGIESEEYRSFGQRNANLDKFFEELHKRRKQGRTKFYLHMTQVKQFREKMQEERKLVTPESLPAMYFAKWITENMNLIEVEEEIYKEQCGSVPSLDKRALLSQVRSLEEKMFILVAERRIPSQVENLGVRCVENILDGKEVDSSIFKEWEDDSETTIKLNTWIIEGITPQTDIVTITSQKDLGKSPEFQRIIKNFKELREQEIKILQKIDKAEKQEDSTTHRDQKIELAKVKLNKLRYQKIRSVNFPTRTLEEHYVDVTYGLACGKFTPISILKMRKEKVVGKECGVDEVGFTQGMMQAAELLLDYSTNIVDRKDATEYKLRIHEEREYSVDEEFEVNFKENGRLLNVLLFSHDFEFILEDDDCDFGNRE